MTASNTKKKENDKGHGVQLIVFAPANADPADEQQKIYMVCPSALRVVEVVEKYGEDAENYLVKLAQNKEKSALSPNKFIDDIAESVDDDGTMVTEEDFEALNGVDIQGLNKRAKSDLSDELDEEIVAFASGSLGDIFPMDEEEEESTGTPGVDMEDALKLLDEEEDDTDLNSMVNGLSGNDDLDSLPEL